MILQTKLERLLRVHRREAFADGAVGDRHHRALLRLQRTQTYVAMCRETAERAAHRESERLLRMYA